MAIHLSELVHGHPTAYTPSEITFVKYISYKLLIIIIVNCSYITSVVQWWYICDYVLHNVKHEDFIFD